MASRRRLFGGGSPGLAAGEEAPAEEGSFEGVVAVGSAPAEAGDLSCRVEAIDGAAVGAECAGVEVGLDAA